MYHNVNSFSLHKNDFLNDPWYRNADVLVLSETNVVTVCENDVPERFTLLFPQREDVDIQKQRSKGLIIFARSPSEVRNLSKSNIVEGDNKMTNKKWHIDLRSFELGDHCFIVGYKSPHTPIEEFRSELMSIISHNSKNSTFVTILGDFNINVRQNEFFERLLPNFKNQLGVNTSTTDAKTQIDVVFSNSSDGFGGTRCSYFSDHFSIFYQTELKTETCSLKSKEKIPPKSKTDHDIEQGFEISNNKHDISVYDDKVQNIPDSSNQYVMFKNSYQFNLNFETHLIKNVCPFNSVIHGIVKCNVSLRQALISILLT
jgi:hypothetical protein